MWLLILVLTAFAGTVGYLIGHTHVNMDLVRMIRRTSSNLDAVERMVEGFESDLVEFAAEGDPLAKQLLYRIAEHKRELENRESPK